MQDWILQLTKGKQGYKCSFSLHHGAPGQIHKTAADRSSEHVISVQHGLGILTKASSSNFMQYFLVVITLVCYTELLGI